MECVPRPGRGPRRVCTRTSPRPIGATAIEGRLFALDESGFARLVGDERSVPAPDARSATAELGDLLGRPIELLSVRANPLGAKHVVSVATREVTRDGAQLRSGAASDPDPVRALGHALLTAHAGRGDLLEAALGRLVGDGVATGAVLVRRGTVRSFGAAEPDGLLTRLAHARSAAPTAGARPVRVLLLEDAAVALAARDDSAAALLDGWCSAVLASTGRSQPLPGRRP
jgi:hypothetical protein